MQHVELVGLNVALRQPRQPLEEDVQVVVLGPPASDCVQSPLPEGVVPEIAGPLGHFVGLSESHRSQHLLCWADRRCKALWK